MFMNVATLTKIVAEDAALRRCQRLQPVGGRGDKVFPPTYPGEGRNNPHPRHVFERRSLDAKEVLAVFAVQLAILSTGMFS
jgi:CRISPR-associated protein Csb1